MIDIREPIVQFCSQVLGLFLVEELRACSDGSGGSGLPMDNVRFHTTPTADDTIGRAFLLIRENVPLGWQPSKGGFRHPPWLDPDDEND
jgi:hypothetical protein